PPEVKKIKDDEQMMKEMGHHDHGIPLDESLRKKLYEELKTRVTWMGIGALPFLIVMLSMLFGLGDLNMLLGDISLENIGIRISLLHFLQFLLATPILFIGGKEVFQSAISAWKVKATNMDTLIALGTFAAWLYSTVV